MSMGNIQLNDDGWSVKGCSIIYAPSGQAGEYAKLATNPYRGCGNRCSYCYVPAVLRMSRAEFDAGARPRDNFLLKLRNNAAKYRAAGITEQVMLSFTTDPYHPFDTSLTREVLLTLKEYGLGFCTLTKGGKRAMRDIDLFRPDRDAFASTLTTLSPAASEEWEAGAALPEDRIATLRAFHEAGIYTWVSLEPVIDTETTLRIIRETHRFVDLFKVGRINYHRLTQLIDWKDFTAQVLRELNRTHSDYYIKEDLQPYLPKNYFNVKYRTQARAAGVVDGRQAATIH